MVIESQRCGTAMGQILTERVKILEMVVRPAYPNASYMSLKCKD